MSDLPARMLTCATFLATIEISQMLTDEQMEAIIDARSLLVEAASALEKLNPPPKPMEIIPPLPIKASTTWPADAFVSPGAFVDPGVPPTPGEPSGRTCPSCGSHTAKTVHRMAKGVELECPVCNHRWPWKGKAKWI
jgi:DNA-directed RNA polymerase subunit RPC12/RpoP